MRRLSLLVLVFSSLLFMALPASANSVRNGTTNIVWAHPDTGEMALRFNVEIDGITQRAFGVVSTDRKQARQTARISMTGTIKGQQGGASLADITFEGQLRNGLPITASGEARLFFERNAQLRVGSTASGDMRFTATIGEGDSAVQIAGKGRISLENVIRTSDRESDSFVGTGTLKYLPSSTEGSPTD